MNTEILPPPADANEEISALIETLHKTGQRLEELTGGEVDTVTDRDGRIVLLRRAQDHLRHSEAAKQAAILNALPAHIALLDAQGRIISVNQAWRRFAGSGVAHAPGHEIGLDYLGICEGARGHNALTARQAAAGTRSVLDGAAQSFSIEYACHTPAEQRWFLMTVTPLAGDQRRGAVVMHLNITDRKRGEEELLRFGAAIDAIGDAIYLVDRASMSFVHVNDAACRMLGHTRDQLLALGPEGAFAIPRAELERIYDAIIAGGLPQQLEMLRPRMDGTEAWIELRRHPLRAGDGWTIVALVRDITERKVAEQTRKRAERLLKLEHSVASSLADADDAGAGLTTIMRTICETKGWEVGRYFALDEAAGLLRYNASWGKDLPAIGAFIDSSRDLTFRPAEGLVGTAWQSGESLWVANASTDPRMKHAAQLHSAQLHAMCMFPVRANGKIIGVLSFSSHEIQAPDARLLQTMALIGGQIGLFVVRQAQQAHIARLNRIYKVLSGINTLIVHARDRDELFKEACRIAVEAGAFRMAWVGIVDGGAMKIVPVASAGAEPEFLALVQDRFSLRQDAPMGNTMSARAVREKKAFVSNEIKDDAKVLFASERIERGISSMAILPLLVAGNAVGVLALYADQIGFFDEQELKLLTELAGDIAFAIDHLDKEAERKQAEVRIVQLSRVYAVLSGINTLIVHARDRDELFREATRIAVEHGKFLMAWIGIVARVSGRIEPVASAGDVRDFFDVAPMDITEVNPDSLGLAGRAIAHMKAMISNDVHNDPQRLMRKEMGERGINSLALLPLIVDGEAIGILALYSADVGFFDEEEMKLLVELAGDISFAIDHLGKEEKINYLAYFDALTGLANRSLFLERVGQSILGAAAKPRALAVIVVDVERFKLINETLGRTAGDELLRQIAGRLAPTQADQVRYARIGADQFAAVSPDVESAEWLMRRVEASLERIFGPRFKVGGTELKIAARLGIAIFPDDGADAETLLSNAEFALKKAKASGEKYLFYTQQMTDRVAGRLTLENQLRHALEREEFVLHYQPKVNLGSGKLAAAEALIRWNDPRTGLVPPGRFIPILEETGLIYDVGRWALRQAVAEYLRWCAAGLPAVRIAVNVSPLQLRNRNFVEEVRQAIGIDPRAAAGLELEITESLIMEDVERNIAILKSIRETGVSIALDDFGTGYSSLSLLGRLPVDTLKIDRSFIIEMTSGPNGLALVQTIITLAHSLGLKVVAEGVETEEQSHLLRLLSCDEMQGFLFSKPVPAATFEANFLAAKPIAVAELASGGAAPGA